VYKLLNGICTKLIVLNNDLTYNTKSNIYIDTVNFALIILKQCLPVIKILIDRYRLLLIVTTILKSLYR